MHCKSWRQPGLSLILCGQRGPCLWISPSLETVNLQIQFHLNVYILQKRLDFKARFHTAKLVNYIFNSQEEWGN